MPIRRLASRIGVVPTPLERQGFSVRQVRVRLLVNADNAPRVMSRTEAKRRFTVEDHVHATEGVEYRKDAEVIDETPIAYKDIDAVVAAQADLIEVAHTLRVVCVKG
jgi:tRNA-splicing ligase RtcB